MAARGGQVVTLEPLAPADVTDLVGRVIGGQPGQRLAKLTERAGGNPLYARELADALIRGEQLQVSAGVAELAGSAAAIGVPVSLAALGWHPSARTRSRCSDGRPCSGRSSESRILR
jgi:predicted ATPase